MADEPIGDVVARVLALDEKATPGPWRTGEGLYAPEICADGVRQIVADLIACDSPDAAWIASTRTDAAALAREVARLTEELAKEQMERSDGEREIERLRAGIEALRARCQPDEGSNVSTIYAWFASRLAALLAPTTEPTSTETTDG